MARQRIYGRARLGVVASKHKTRRRVAQRPKQPLPIGFQRVRKDLEAVRNGTYKLGVNLFELEDKPSKIDHNTTYTPSHHEVAMWETNPVTGQNAFTEAISNSLFENFARRAHIWATDTVELWKEEIRRDDAVDTGTLHDSIKILSEKKDATAGTVEVVVGVDEETISVEGYKETGKAREYIEKYKHKNKKTGKVYEGEFIRTRKAGYKRKMPGYDYSPYVLGEEGSHPTITKSVAAARGGKRDGRGNHRRPEDIDGPYANNLLNGLFDIADDNFKKMF